MKRAFPGNIKLPGLGDLALLTLFSGAIWASHQIADDPGIGWHLRTGQWIAQHQQIPFTDPFLATSGSAPWIANQWLSDLIIWKIFALGSWPLLHVVTAVLLLTPFMILSAIVAREGEGGITVFLALILCGMVSTVQWIVRPVVMSFVLFTALFALLRRYEQGEKPDLVVLLALQPLFLIWANLHPGFPMGFLLIGCFIAAHLTRGQTQHAASLTLAALCAVGATLINPYDIGLLRNIAALVGNQFFMGLNSEWHSPDFLSLARLPVLLLVGILLFFGPRNFSLSALFSVSVFLFMSLMSVRYLPFLAYVAVLPLTEALRSIPLLRRLPLRGGSATVYSAIGMIALLLIVAARGEIPGMARAVSAPSGVYPEAAVATIVADSEGGAVFLSPNWGGFLTFYGYPRRLAFIDDRNELNGEALYKSYFQIVQARADWRELLDGYDITWMLLSPGDIVGTALTQEPGWTLISESAVHKLFRRKRI